MPARMESRTALIFVASPYECGNKARSSLRKEWQRLGSSSRPALASCRALPRSKVAAKKMQPAQKAFVFCVFCVFWRPARSARRFCAQKLPGKSANDTKAFRFFAFFGGQQQWDDNPTCVLLQLHRPVGVVEEGAPGLVFTVSELEVEERAAFGFFGLADQGHAGLLGGAATFANVAANAGADDVVPSVVAALAARNDVIQAQLGSRILAAAELTLVVVAGEDVAAIELHRLLGQLLIGHETDDPRHLDLAIDRPNPIVVFLAEMAGAEFTQLAPGGEIVSGELAFLEADHLSGFFAKQTDGPLHRDNMHGHVQLVQDQNTCLEGRVSVGTHKAPLACGLHTTHLH